MRTIANHAAPALLALALLQTAGCCVRRPAYVVMPWKEFQLNPPVDLPLTPDGRGRLEKFFAKHGNNSLPDTVPDVAQTDERQFLDALSDPANLTIDLSAPRKQFCDDAQALCRSAPMFRKRPLVRQIVDAEKDRPKPSSQPLAVSDGNYWYIFDWKTSADNRKTLTALKVVRDVDREVTR
jgi:hypothetical protein